MSTKLNAEELAEKRYAQYQRSTSTEAGITGYTAAIREVAQPIADERDELRNALENCLWVLDGTVAASRNTIADDEVLRNGKAILAKYPKP
jgi:hypothetical protein